MTDKPRVAIYARSATAPNPDSIAAQISACQACAEQQNWNVVLTASDEGISGTRLERPGLSQILSLMAQDGLDIIVSDGQQRFSRDPNVRRELRAICDDHGTRLRVLDFEKIRDPAIGFDRFAFQL